MVAFVSERRRRQGPSGTQAGKVYRDGRREPTEFGRTKVYEQTAEPAATDYPNFLVIDNNHVRKLVHSLSATSLVGILVNSLAPLHDVAVHIEQAQLVGLKEPHRVTGVVRVQEIPFILAGQVLRVAKGKPGRRSCPAGVLPFRVRRQSIADQAHGV